VIDASPAAITLALLLTDEELDSLETTTANGWRDRVPTSQPFSRSLGVYRSRSLNSGIATSRD
jgi:hypothetical protein